MINRELSPQQIELSESSNDAVEILRNFIVTYESLPELWNPSNASYNNKSHRAAAYDKLLTIFKRLKSGATRVDVKKKINTLRSNYRKELRKVLASNISGRSAEEIYRPTSWLFYALNFLRKCEQTANGYDQVDEIHYKERVQEEELDEQSPLSVPVTSRSSILSLPLPQKKRRTIRPLQRQNELLQKVCSFLEQPSEPNMPTIAKFWGETLLTLDPQQRALAEKAVNDILFEAGQGTLHRHSVKINEGPKLEAVLHQPSINNWQPHHLTSSGKILHKISNKDEDTIPHSINFNG